MDVEKLIAELEVAGNAWDRDPEPQHARDLCRRAAIALRAQRHGHKEGLLQLGKSFEQLGQYLQNRVV